MSFLIQYVNTICHDNPSKFSNSSWSSIAMSLFSWIQLLSVNMKPHLMISLASRSGIGSYDLFCSLWQADTFRSKICPSISNFSYIEVATAAGVTCAAWVTLSCWLCVWVKGGISDARISAFSSSFVILNDNGNNLPSSWPAKNKAYLMRSAAHSLVVEFDPIIKITISTCTGRWTRFCATHYWGLTVYFVAVRFCSPL